MLRNNFLIASSLILLLSSCARPPEPEVVIQTEYVEKQIPIQVKPKPVQLAEVQWYVVTKENLDDFIERFEKENGDLAFMAISVRGYENLALNVQELRRYVKQQNQIILFYENAVQ